jgi:excisionase family DNA binding protein
VQQAVVYPEVYAVEEFAKLFKLSPEAVRNLIRRGEISAIRLGTHYRIPQDVVDRYLRKLCPLKSEGLACGSTSPRQASRM